MPYSNEKSIHVSVRSSRKFIHNYSEMEIMDLLLKEMELQGLIFESKDLPIRMDGVTRYVKVSGRSRLKMNSRSGWYVGHLGEYPVGKFGWMHGDNPSYSWSLYDHVKDRNGGKAEFIELTPEEIERDRIDKERKLKLKIIADRNRFNFSRALATIEYHRSLPLRPHPYLTIKKIDIADCGKDVRIYNQTPYTKDELRTILAEHLPLYNTDSNIRKLIDYQTEEIKYRGFNLLIVGRNIEGEILMFQLIFDKKSRKTGKNKHFPSGLIKQNTFHTIGPELTPETKKYFTCEGWATGLSLYKLTQGRVTIIVAWDSGNMNNVAKVLRKFSFWSDLYSANDNDHTKPPSKNAGILGGLKSCNAVGAFMLTPKFDSQIEDQKDLSDWNDIDLYYDFTDAQAILVEEFKNAEFISASYLDGIELLSEKDRFNANDYFEIDLSQINQVEFNLNWITFVSLISLGLMNCEFTLDEKIALYHQQFTITLKNHEATSHDYVRHYDFTIDKKLSYLFYKFNCDLLLSTKSILINDDLFIPMIHELLNYQSFTDQNLFTVFRDQIATQKDLEFANALINMYLEKSQVFRDNSTWRRDITFGFRAQFTGDIEFGLFHHIITKQSETLYWDISSKIERENKAIADIIRIYENNIVEFAKLNMMCMDLHYSKLPYLYGAANKLMLTDSEENKQYLQKLIAKVYETYNLELNLQDFIYLD